LHILSSTDSCQPDGFIAPLELTAGYLDMHWCGLLHGQLKRDLELSPQLRERARRFGDTVFDSSQPSG
jgi:hypothetical protein